VRWLQRLDSFRRAHLQLPSAVDLNQQRSLSELEQQGLIQAFEFTYELVWNVMKDYLRSLGNSTVTASLDSSRAAFAAELIADGESWLDMIVSRNLSSHTHNRDTANSLVYKIANSYAVLFATFERKMMNFAHGSSH
jgi:nucleotidyltransferase substrate binding protein (TIGR01987 family)